MINKSSTNEAIEAVVDTFKRVIGTNQTCVPKYCTLVIDTDYVEFTSMYHSYKNGKYDKPIWPVASLPCFMRDRIEIECVEQNLLDENGDYWGYDWDAITTEKMRLHEDQMQIGCDNHGWINFETLSEWMQESTDFYCNIGLVVLDNVSLFLKESAFQKFSDKIFL